jgi:hypothetical protein
MKDIIDAHHSELLESMPIVASYHNNLNLLNRWWSAVGLIGKVNCEAAAIAILEEMESTQKKFIGLQKELIHNLISENLQKTFMNDAAVAQMSIDVLNRNLFERTADVGFLSTNHELRRFLASDEERENTKSHIENLLDEYVKKYSVYDEIVLLQPNGKVIAQLGKENRLNHSSDPLIPQTINTKEPYVETFRHSDLQPDQQQSLIYSATITTDDSPQAEILGVLCLCFRFEDEVQTIFSSLLGKNSPSTAVILDKDGLVISTTNKETAEIGEQLIISRNQTIATYGEARCIFHTANTEGYQGYKGLEWHAQVITPFDIAFQQAAKQSKKNQRDSKVTELFSSGLQEVQDNARNINRKLRLVAFNGKVIAGNSNAQSFMPILDEIQQISEEISSIFTASIGNLQDTVVSAQLSDVRRAANLAVEIMDRNLYERANDCRWWALTALYKDTLAKEVVTEQDRENLSTSLSYINSLYTVYTNLYIYNKGNKIIAVSNPREKEIIGTSVNLEHGIHDPLNPVDSQKYSVSPFVSTALYADRPTYIYNATITHPERSHEIIGGIGIVFDSEPEFKAILMDTLPRNSDGAIPEGCFSLFADRKRRVISICNSDKYAIGDKLPVIGKGYFNEPIGFNTSNVAEVEGKLYTAGIAISKGYREYKTTHDYKNDIITLLFMPL